MQEYIKDWKNNKEYVDLLKLIGSLSNLFSDSDIPYIHYRITENLFCKCFGAENMSRSDVAYDAKIGKSGVGIKTFTFGDNGRSLEKVAEFNKLSAELRELKHLSLAIRVSKLRNERILMANNLYDIDKNFYHIIGRNSGNLCLYNCDYNLIDIHNIRDIKAKKDTGITFNDGVDEYTYNHSKSVLYKQFNKSTDSLDIPIEIYSDPYEVLKELLGSKTEYFHTKKPIPGVDYIILPLYSDRKGGYVPERSGLNQWNAKGRTRSEDEVYVPIPKFVNNNFPDFFPERSTPFTLILPNNLEITAKICQDSGKSLMSNPNSALGKWILRDIMKLNPGELVKMNKLYELGFDSVIITKIDSGKYTINVGNYENSYHNFRLNE